MTTAFRIRLLAGWLLLSGLAFAQDPGLLVADTKFDLVTSPGGFLERALHVWDPQGALGQLQNQAYGYLWPMGPFFWVSDALGVPGWVTQRLWWSLVIGVAFVGAAWVARAVGVRSDLACLVAGVAYALSPRMLTTLGPISIEAWPGALAPWVLLPLVIGSQRGSPRRAAALAGLAVAMVGGVNAAATFAVIPLGVVWLLTRTAGPRRRSLMLWWPVFTLLGTLWWLVPLFVLGAYSPPFLDFIESTSVTTFPTTPFDTIRGTSNWVPYIDPGSRAGNDLVTTGYLALNSGVLLVLGFAGILRRQTPVRAFLAWSVAIGVVMVSAGHYGAVSGWFAGDLRTLLDGVLAPLRNVHKFDPVVRLPLVLGLAFALQGVLGGDTERARDPGGPSLARVQRVAFLGMTVLALVGSMLPAVFGRVAPAGALLGVPGYWTETSDWLSEHEDAGGAILVPGSGFADYLWGSPRDEPLQWGTSARWVVRNAIPLTPPGTIRMLDALEERFAQGRGSSGVATALARAGIAYVVIRNDLERDSDVPDPVVVHQAIRQSPGLTRVARFGPMVGGGAHLDRDDTRLVVNGGWQAEYPAVEIYAVAAVPAVAATPAVVAGGPEDVLDLADLGIVEDRPTILAADVPGDWPSAHPEAPLVLTDGLRARERFFGRIHDSASAAITPGDVRRNGNPSRDYLAPGQDAWSTTVRLEGAAGLSASSSRSDANAVGGARRGDLPYAAIDGSPQTQWVSMPTGETPAWWQVDLGRSVPVREVTVTGGADAPDNQQVRVAVGEVTSEPVDLGPGETRTVPLPEGAGGSSVRVSAVNASILALAEVQIAGVRVDRSLVLPTLPASWGDPDAVVLRADRDARTGCLLVKLRPRCVVDQVVSSEESLGFRRVVPLPGGGIYAPRLSVRPKGGEALDAMVLQDQPVAVSASSQGVPDPLASPVSAVDGDPRTSWSASVDDLRPTLTLSWLGERSVTGVRVGLSNNTAGREPTRLTLTWSEGHLDVPLVDGRASFPPILTDRLEIRVEESEDAVGLDFSGQSSVLPVAIGEIRLRGVPYLPLGLSGDARDYPCGTGPEVTIGAQVRQTAVSASPAALHAGVPVMGRVCAAGLAPLSLTAGENEVIVTDSDSLAAESLVLRRVGEPAAAEDAAPVSIQSSGPVGRRIDPDGPLADGMVLGLRENANPGWEAVQSGRMLTPVVLDGWQQGWLLTEDTAPVRARFAPDGPYRTGLGVGLLMFLLLAVSVLLGSRRRHSVEPPALRSRRIPPAVALVGTLAVGGWVAGWPGIAVVAGAALVLLLARGRIATLVTGEVLAWSFAGPCLVVAAAYAIAPWGSSGGWAGSWAWAGYVALVPLTGMLLATAEPRSRREP